MSVRLKKIRYRRLRMWQEDPHCRRCGVLTVLPESVDLKALQKAGRGDHIATIDHMVTRYDAELRRSPQPNEMRWRLVCYRCNGELAREREMQVPLEERQRRSGRLPVGAA